jgi:alcohol dehydrogenase (cytochrome c)
MFLTLGSTRVVALDARTGHEIWRHDNKLTDDKTRDPSLVVGVPGGTYPNRGVALLDDKVFVGTTDARLIALSAATGNVVWDKSLSPDPGLYAVSSAPLAVGDLIVTGVATRGGGRGFIVALDKDTGRERWRFTTVPAPGDTGGDTWKGDSWQRGGGPPWLTGSYDPQEDLLIWGVGNPKPDYDHSKRLGDNLYTNSVVALRGKTGKLVWHFQFTPGDDHDWDSAQIPLLVDDSSGTRKRILWANRNGFYYVLDRLTGRFVTGVPFVHENWASGLDSTGRPILVTDSARKRAGSLVYPGNVGGTSWWAPSFDPKLNLVFVPVLEQGMVFFSSTSSWPQPNGGHAFYTAVRALDPATGALKWEYRHDPRMEINRTGGVMTTSSGVLFGGDLTTFFALDSRTGRELWSVETGGTIHAAPVTYTVDGEQFVSIVAGKNMMTFALPRAQQPSKGKEALTTRLSGTQRDAAKR